jgi:hypothetical protein
LVGSGDRAGGVSTKETVADPSNDGITELAQGPGDTDQQGAKAGPAIPRVAEDLQRADDGVGAAVEALVGAEGIGDDDDPLGRAGGGRDRDQFQREATLKRGETELAAVVVAKDKTDDSVAEGANAIVKEDRTAFDLGAFHFGHRGGRFGLLYCVDAA